MDLVERTALTVRHPWEVARVSHVASLLRMHGVPVGSRVLDAGAGDSYVALTLGARFEGLDLTCWDVNYTDEDLAVTPGGVRRVASQPDGRFDVVLALDVIEHVLDDVSFLKDLRAMSHPGSLLVATVPAYQALFSEHDVRLRHYRRYSRRQLLGALAEAGWTVHYAGGFFSSLLPVRSVMVLAQRLRGSAVRPDCKMSGTHNSSPHLGDWRRGASATRAFAALLSLDAKIGRSVARVKRLGLPGLSVFAVASPSVQETKP